MIQLIKVVRRYYELKLNVHQLETVEEITYTEAPPSESEAQRRRSKLESVDSENMISVSQEERKRYIIASVSDPRDENKTLSLREATSSGIVHYPTGRYVNPDTGQGQNVSPTYFDIQQFGLNIIIIIITMSLFAQGSNKNSKKTQTLREHIQHKEIII